MVRRHGVQGNIQWWRWNQLRDAAVVLVSCADLDVGAERLRDLVTDELLERLTGSPPDHLADQVTS
jgi:hypothetical protein